MKYKTSSEDSSARSEICSTCPELKSNAKVGMSWKSCGVCGCPLLSLINLSTAHCPKGKWSASHKEL